LLHLRTGLDSPKQPVFGRSRKPFEFKFLDKIVIKYYKVVG